MRLCTAKHKREENHFVNPCLVQAEPASDRRFRWATTITSDQLRTSERQPDKRSCGFYGTCKVKDRILCSAIHDNGQVVANGPCDQLNVLGFCRVDMHGQAPHSSFHYFKSPYLHTRLLHLLPLCL
jgi:hypothetical protein